MTEALIPVLGKILPVTQVGTEDLKRFVELTKQRLDADGIHLGNIDDARRIEAALAVLAHREEEEFSQTSSIDAATSVESKVLTSPAEVTTRLRALATNHHLVAPAPSVDFVPEGFGVEFVFIRFSVEDFFEIEGSSDFCLRAPALKMLAADAGLSWDASESSRRDDGKDPHFAHYLAAGKVQRFDGTPRLVSGSSVLDWRDGSKNYEMLRLRFPEKMAFADELRERRSNLHGKAETAAKLRAICDLGIKRRYSPDERFRPFAVAKLTFTGQCSDPTLTREMATLRARAALGASSLLYGDQQETAA